MATDDTYTCRIVWTGDRGAGTRSRKDYGQSFDIATPGRRVINCSSAPVAGGDPSLPNPEDILLASLSACHMLWYLDLAGNAGLVVRSYRDDPVGLAETEASGAARFLKAILRPVIAFDGPFDADEADVIHHDIHKLCFIARSVNFPIGYDATYRQHGEDEVPRDGTSG